MSPQLLLRPLSILIAPLVVLPLAAGLSRAVHLDFEALPPCNPLIPVFEGESYVGATEEGVPFTGRDLQPSGECGIAPFVPVDDANGSFGITGTEGERHLRIDTADGTLQADEVRSNRPQNPDPATGRPRIAGSEGSCPLPTGAEDNYWPSEDCLRPGPTTYGEVPNDGLNEGLSGLLIPDGTIFTLDQADSAGHLQYPQLVPANSVPYFIGNDSLLANPVDIRRRYADPADGLYQGDKFRAAMPRCTEPGQDKASCVAPLYVSQLDALNTSPGGEVSEDDLYRPETEYTESNAEVSRPGNLDFFDSLCEWSSGAALGILYPTFYQAELSSEAVYLSQLYEDPEACAAYLADRGYPVPPGGSCEDEVASSGLLGLFSRIDADAAFAAHAENIRETGDSCFFDSFGIVFLNSALQTRTVVAQTLAGYSYLAIVGPLGGTTLPFVELWKDVETVDGSTGGSRERAMAEFAGCFDFRATHKFGLPNGRRCDLDEPGEDRSGGDDPKIDFLTLNAMLTPEQEAILGCGPFFGNNCDASGVNLFDSQVLALTQSFVDAERDSEFDESWRTDGLPPGARVHVGGEPLLGGDRFDPDVGLLSDLELCRKANGTPAGGCQPLDADDRLLIKRTDNPYFGLYTDEVRMQFTPALANCSTWLGRTSPGVDCVERYAQPGTIGARDIGFGTFDLEGDVVPGPTHPNFFKQRGPICSTTAFGGSEDHALPGCRNKWRNYQDEYLMREGVKTKELNLFGIDKYCQERPSTRAADSACTTDAGGSPLPGGQVYGGEFSPRADPRSWDATRDGDPDFVGFDSQQLVDELNSRRLHAAAAFRTELVPGNVNRLEEFPGVSDPNRNNVFRRCDAIEYFPTDQFVAGVFQGRGASECSRFQRDGRVDENTGGPVTDTSTAVVFPKGVGHPFTGQPWATELSALSWNLMVLLVRQSTEFQDLAIPEIGREDDFPFVARYPLAYSTFDPNAPENESRMSDLNLIQEQLEDGTITGEQEILQAHEDMRQLRAEMAPICSLITPARCGKIREFLSYTARIDEGEPGMRRWLWETGSEYAVTSAADGLAEIVTVHAAGPRVPEIGVEESGDGPEAFARRGVEQNELEWPLLLIAAPEPSALALEVAALMSLAALVRCARLARPARRARH